MTAGLRVLAIDTSTEACSAAVLQADGTALLRFVLTERSHADLILPMIDELLQAASLGLTDLDGLAFGRGPGGFTGLRVAAGVIQGMAYGANLRVAPVSSLAAVAYQVLRPVDQRSADRPALQMVDAPKPVANNDVVAGAGAPARALVCNDARMSEVYWSCFTLDPAAPDIPLAITPERVSPPSEVEASGQAGDVAGNGLARYPELRARLQAQGWTIHDNLYPRADAIARIGAAMLQRGEFVTAAGAVPVYVRDDVARPSIPPVTGMS